MLHSSKHKQSFQKNALRRLRSARHRLLPFKLVSEKWRSAVAILIFSTVFLLLRRMAPQKEKTRLLLPFFRADKQMAFDDIWLTTRKLLGQEAPTACTKARPRVYYICETGTEGAIRYIRDLISHYTIQGLEFHSLPSKAAARAAASMFCKDDILLFMYLTHTDFTFDDVRSLVSQYKLRLVIPIHDRYFLTKDYNASSSAFNKGSGISQDQLQILRLAEYIIFPSEFLYRTFSKHFTTGSMVIVPDIDQQLHRHLYIPPLDKNMHIGIITEASHGNGLELLEKLFQHSVRKKPRVRFFFYADYDNSLKFPHLVVRGGHLGHDLYQKMEEDQIHGLLFLNNYPESYGYALTKGINSGLPFLYTRMGPMAERLTKEDHTYYIATNSSDLNEQFLHLLDVIERHAGQGKKTQRSLQLLEMRNVAAIPRFYDTLFFESASSIMHRVRRNYDRHAGNFANIHRRIQPYAVFFPQFHPIAENDVNFYKGYTDMMNLIGAKVHDPKLSTPLKNVLGFYNLVEDKDVIPRQIQLAKSYGIYGFAIYYYWFSDNSITGKHMIFEEVIKRFFEKELKGFSVFFIYCNEGWTNNVSFDTNEGEHTISNRYNEENIIANMENLVAYFKHENYRKINNRPLFFLHHPQKMTPREIHMLKIVGDRIMTQHGFAGLELVVDGMGEAYPGYPSYYQHSNYKSPKGACFIDSSVLPKRIDYETYVRRFLVEEQATLDTSEVINSVFTNFDTSVRFYMHDEQRQFGKLGNKTMYITRTQKNSMELFKEFLDIQFDKYHKKQNSLSQLFLINAWNEWGEQMMMEPSNEEGFAYLEAFQERLLYNFLTEDLSPS